MIRSETISRPFIAELGDFIQRFLRAAGREGSAQVFTQPPIVPSIVTTTKEASVLILERKRERARKIEKERD